MASVLIGSGGMKKKRRTSRRRSKNKRVGKRKYKKTKRLHRKKKEDEKLNQSLILKICLITELSPQRLISPFCISNSFNFKSRYKGNSQNIHFW